MSLVWREVQIVALLCSWYYSTVPTVCHLGVTHLGVTQGKVLPHQLLTGWWVPSLSPEPFITSQCSVHLPVLSYANRVFSQSTFVIPTGFPMLNIIGQEELDSHSQKYSCTSCTSARPGWQTVYVPRHICYTHSQALQSDITQMWICFEHVSI